MTTKLKFLTETLHRPSWSPSSQLNSISSAFCQKHILQSFTKWNHHVTGM